MVEVSKAFSFQHNLCATLAGRLDVLRLSPNHSAILLLSKEWDLPSYIRQNLLAPVEERGGIRDQGRSITPPSSSTYTFSPKFGPVCRCDMADLSCDIFSESPRGDLDATQIYNNQFTLMWQHQAPTFQSNLDVYIWQPYRELPASRYADMFLIPSTSTATTEIERVIVSFKSTNSLHLFRSIRDPDPMSIPETDLISVHKPVMIYQPGSARRQFWSPMSEVILSIIPVFKVMISESIDFLQGCDNQIQSMVSSPFSISKTNDIILH
jgi:hypothetical protein